MNSSLFQKAKNFISQRHRYRRWLKAIMAMAMVVVFVTTYMLVLPAVTLEQTGDEGKTSQSTEANVQSLTAGDLTLSEPDADSSDNLPAAADLRENAGAAPSDADSREELLTDTAGDSVLPVRPAAYTSRATAGADWNIAVNASGGYTLTYTGEKIPDNFFENCAELAPYKDMITTLVIKSNVTEIGETAFKNVRNLVTVDFENGSQLTKIGSAAFSGAEELKNVNLENCTQLTVIDNAAQDKVNDAVALTTSGAFYNTAITNIEIPASVQMIDSCTFYKCKKLQRIHFAETDNSINTLGFAAFGACEALEEINLEACTQPSIALLSGAPYYERGLFNGCKSLKSVTIPSGFGADSVNNTLNGMFIGCWSLESITFEENTHITGKGSSGQLSTLINLKGDDHNAGVKYLDMTPLKNMVCTGNWMLQSTSLETVKLPKSLETIDSGAFGDSGNGTMLANVIFEEGSRLTYIRGNAFERNKVLTGIDWSNLTQLREINGYAFNGCEKLDNVTLPPSLTTLGKMAFAGCTNLREFTYNASNLVIGNTDGDRCEDVFSGVDSGFTLKIGSDVENLPVQFLQNAAGHCGDIIFEGTHSFNVTGSGSTGLDAPLDNLSGTYYTENGVLYKINEDGTASLVYASPNVVSCTVPETVNGCKVTSVGANAFTDAAEIHSVMFSAPENISVYENAFKGCKKLIQVNGHTQLSNVTALFEKVDETAFLETGLTGSGRVELNGMPISSGTIKVSDVLQISVDSEDILTGESAYVNIFMEHGQSDPNAVYRVYIEYGDGCVLQYEPDKDITLEGEDIKIRATDIPNVYYYEFVPPKEGNTFNMPIPFSYSNYTAGGDVRVWAVRSEGAFTEEKNVLLPAENSEYFNMTWKTRPDKFIVDKSANTELPVKLRYIGESMYSVENLSFNIGFTRENSTYEGKGSDIVRYVDFKDALALPEGITYREGLLDAVKAGHYRCSRNSSGNFEVYVTIGTKEYLFCVLQNITNIIPDIRITVENEQPVLCWTMYNRNENTAKMDIEKDYEISQVNNILTYGPEVLITNTLLAETDTLEIANGLDTTRHHTFSESTVMEHKSANAVVSGGTGSITMNKTRNNDVSRMGEDVQYTIKIENPTAYDYVITKNTNLNDDFKFNGKGDDLYLKPENIEAMFQSTNGTQLKVTIVNKDDKSLQLAKPVHETITTIDGQTQHVTSAQNTGYNVEHDGLSTVDTALEGVASLEISMAGGRLCLRRIDSGLPDLYIGAGEQFTTLKEALDSIGFFVTDDTKYKLKWLWPAAETLHPGEVRYFTYTATLKDSLMMLHEDWLVNNQGTAEVGNHAQLWGGSGGLLESSSTRIEHVPHDLAVYKDATLNGEELGEGFKIEDNMVLDYDVYFYHNGTSTYDLLPLVDHMSGAQVALAPAAENQSAEWAADTEKYTIDGVEYYLLKLKNNQETVYKGVWLGGKYADSVAVSASQYGGLDTIIKWYYENTLPLNFTSHNQYKALTSKEHTGYASDAAVFNVSNEVWLNDHQTHRLWDIVYGGGSRLEFDKKIVTEKGSDPAADILDPDDHSTVGRGESVTYRLEFKNITENPIVLNGSDIYDKLPQTGGLFQWSKENISLSYLTEEGISVQNETSWALADLVKDVETAEEGQQYIKWGDDFSVEFGKLGSIYIYVTLKFPEDHPLWKQYCDKNSNTDVINTLFMYNFSHSVSHELVDRGSVMLQKGVYETGLYRLGFNHNRPAQSDYTRGKDRLHYSNTDLSEHTVTYYVVLKNSGTTRLYLNPLYDELPEGFEFLYLNNRPDQGWGGVGTDHIYENQMIKVPDWPLAEIHTSGTEIVRARIHWDKIKTTEGRDILKFTVDERDGEDGSGKDLSYDEARGKYYLEPNQYLSFGYTVLTNEYENSRDKAVNTIAMEYDDYQKAGVELDTETKVTVTEFNKLHLMGENDGSRKIMDNEEALNHHFENQNPESNPQWIASDVTVTRGEIVPGITKTVDKPISNTNDMLTWTVKAANTGTYPIINYTITDTMRAPYTFLGDVNYEICCDTTYNDGWNIMQTTKQLAAMNPLFSFVSWDNVNNKAVIRSNRNNETYEIPLDGTETDVNINWIIGDQTTEKQIKVSMGYDTNGNVTFSIVFPDSCMAIPGNGYGSLRVSTQNQTSDYHYSVYSNQAVLAPRSDYNAADITQGNNITDENGNNKGVRNTAYTTVTSTYSTTSVKRITEKGNQANTASSEDDKTYILLTDKSKLVTYTLEVNNDNDKSMAEFILIDNLPEPNDHATLDDKDERYSAFKVKFAENPNMTVKVNGTVLDPSKYTVHYNTATSFPVTSDAWKYDNDTGWSGSSVDARSFRLKIKDDSGTVIPNNSKITVEFDALIDGEAPSGSIAWNSFAYSYKMNTPTQVQLFAAPLKVGLAVPGVPKIQKQLVTGSGEPLVAAKDETFEFILYDQGQMVNVDHYTPEELFKYIKWPDHDFIYFRLTVRAGESESEIITLDNAKKWQYSNNTFSPQVHDWVWDSNKTYYLLELDNDSDYQYSSINNNESRQYTFKYNPASNIILRCVNTRAPWEIEITKTDTG